MKEVAPNLWQLRGFPPNAVNIYLAGDVLIDAGVKWDKRRIFRQVGDRKLSLLALTHAHPDHQGAAKAVCERYGVEIACHQADVAAMDGSGPIMVGASPRVESIAKKFSGPPYPVGRALVEGDQVGEFTVVHAPGHTHGEVIFWRESDRVAICGDVIATINPFTGIPGLHEAPRMFAVDVPEMHRSIRKLAELRPALICPGHGKPSTDLAKLQSFAVALPPSRGR